MSTVVLVGQDVVRGDAGRTAATGDDPTEPTVNPAEPVLSLSQVEVRVEGQTILTGVDWAVAPGQHWVVIGPNPDFLFEVIPWVAPLMLVVLMVYLLAGIVLAGHGWVRHFRRFGE